MSQINILELRQKVGIYIQKPVLLINGLPSLDRIYELFVSKKEKKKVSQACVRQIILYEIHENVGTYIIWSFRK